MSYDLYFRPRHAAIKEDAFEEYFAGRPNYAVDLPQALYQNEETGVYFVFELRRPNESEDGEDGAAALNINYYRPSYFILEAEPEVSAFVRHFDLLVADPQMGGMGEGEYSADLLVQGWNHGNAFGYKAVHQSSNQASLNHLPTEVLRKSWVWNYHRRARQQQLGEGIFVPKVLYLMVDGKPATAAAWVDGIPMAVPEVDFFIVGRKDLAPRKFFRRIEDHTFVPAAEVRPILERHRLPGTAEFVLDYDQPPPDVVEFVQGLPKIQPEVEGVAPDSMLDRELVQSAL